MATGPSDGTSLTGTADKDTLSSSALDRQWQASMRLILDQEDINTNPGTDYPNFIEYFKDFWPEILIQVQQYLIVYPDEKQALSQMRIHNLQ